MARLRPRARIIRTIGDQLISGPEAALIELVKNAYDADSPDLLIKITPPNLDCPVGAIFISDHGHGMTYDNVLGRWFEPATDDKLQREFSPQGRRMLGAKGIGRFAASRLGSKTVLQSTVLFDDKKSETILVQIDWNDFSAEKYLEDVEIPILRYPLDPNSKVSTGVQLVISELRDTWSQKRLGNLIRELRRVTTPEGRENEFQIRLDLTDFTEEDAGFDGPSLLQELNFNSVENEGNGISENEGSDDTLIVPFRLRNYSDYRLFGDFDANGAFSGSFTICKGDNVAIPISVPAPILGPDEESCGPVQLQVNIYDRETESIAALFTRMGLRFEDIGIRKARDLLTENSGIAIFRSSFRIRPYGEPENDWLELERKRVQDPSRKLGLSQVSGKVTIGIEAVSGLVERSSREGLEHNGQFDRLKTLISGVFIHVEQKRVAFRENAGLSRKASADVSQAKEAASLQAVTNAVRKLPARFQKTVRKAIEKDASAITASLEELDEYQKLLQSRAALGLVVAQVIHEGRRILNPMSSAATALYDQKDWLQEETKRGEAFRKQFPAHAKILQDGAKSMSRLFKRLDPVSGRRRGRPSAFSLGETIDSSVNLFADSISGNGIDVHIEGVESSKAYGYVEDFQAALLNILENAIHWLSASEQKTKVIRIMARRFEKDFKVAVINNGPLIDDSYMSRLFHPGFTLKSEGMGLGLSIAREACRASKGDLQYVAGAPETCFIILFPADAGGAN